MASKFPNFRNEFPIALAPPTTIAAPQWVIRVTWAAGPGGVDETVVHHLLHIIHQTLQEVRRIECVRPEIIGRIPHHVIVVRSDGGTKMVQHTVDH